MNEYWWFGYDCGHAGDARDLTAIENQKSREIWRTFNEGVIRSEEYCFYECVKLADQLRLVERVYNERKEILFRKF